MGTPDLTQRTSFSAIIYHHSALKSCNIIITFVKMFTGIVECIGKVESVIEESLNKIFVIQSPISNNLKIDQSLAHDGVCLTITKHENGLHWATAIDETLKKSTLNHWKIGDEINLERCLKMGDRLDGHWVQGHVDCVGMCNSIADIGGSWIVEIAYKNFEEFRTIQKGSITINGISLTVINSLPGKFSVAIIPYTFENTSIKNLKVGSEVNLEFDSIGKWVREWMH